MDAIAAPEIFGAALVGEGEGAGAGAGEGSGEGVGSGVPGAGTGLVLGGVIVDPGVVDAVDASPPSPPPHPANPALMQKNKAKEENRDRDERAAQVMCVILVLPAHALLRTADKLLLNTSKGRKPPTSAKTKATNTDEQNRT